MVKYLLIPVMLMSLLFPATVHAADSETVAVEGSIINGTENGGSVAGVDVTLKPYKDDAEADSITVKSDEEGHFEFKDLDMESFDSIMLTAVYQGAEYSSELLSFDEGETLKTAEIVVYESTTSDEAVQIAMAHTIVYIGEQDLEIKEYLLFMNASDRTYIGTEVDGSEEERQTLKFSLPRGAVHLSLTMGLMECCVSATENGFSYSMPILPGASEIAYSYIIHDHSGEYDFSQDVYYPVSRYDLLLQGEDVEVKNTQLLESEPMDINGIIFTHLTGGEYARGNTVTASLTNLPGSSNQAVTIWVTVGVALVIILLIGSSIWKRGRSVPVKAEVKNGVEKKRNELLLEIAGLDDDYSDGKIDEKSYRKLREAKKAEAAALMTEGKGKSKKGKQR